MGRARRARIAAADNDVVAMAFGAVAHHDDKAGLDLVMKAKHDEVITQTGAARRSGVTWLTLPAADGLKMLDDLAITADEYPEQATGGPQAEADLRAFLRANPHGLLVVASCTVDASAVS